MRNPDTVPDNDERFDHHGHVASDNDTDDPDDTEAASAAPYRVPR